MPWEFWPLTPYEVSVLMHGAAECEQREWERTAWLAALLMNISGKSLKDGVSVSPEELLGRPKQVQVIDPGAKESELMRRLEAMGLAKE